MDSLEVVSSEMIQIAFWLCTFFWAFGKCFEIIELVFERVIEFIINLIKKEFNSSNEDLNNSLTCNRVEKEQEGSTSR